MAKAKKSHEIGEHSNPDFHTPDQLEPPCELDESCALDAPHNVAAAARNRALGFAADGKGRAE